LGRSIERPYVTDGFALYPEPGYLGWNKTTT